MPVRAVLFDVGDTLVEHWAPRERVEALMREALRPDYASCAWIEDFIHAEIAPRPAAGANAPAGDGALRQETLRWYEEWFARAGFSVDGIDLDRLRVASTLPLDLVSTPVPGAFAALRWCKANGLRVVLVTNTLSRGDDEVWKDWRRFGVADAIDAVVSSHSVGWQKPHRRIFERALELAGSRVDETVMVGDRLREDISGAKRMGLRAVLRRTAADDQADEGVRPDAVIDDLSELPAVLFA